MDLEKLESLYRQATFGESHPQMAIMPLYVLVELKEKNNPATMRQDIIEFIAECKRVGVSKNTNVVLTDDSVSIFT